MEAIAVAVVSGVFGLATIVVQRRVHRDNRSDHAQTVAKVDELVSSVGALDAKVDDVRADVREVKADLRDHSARLRVIEHPEPKPRTRKKAV